MTKFRLFGLSLLALAMVSLVDCKGNKNGGADESSLNDTLANYDQFGIPMSEETPEAAATTDANADEQAPVFTENQNGSIQAATEDQISNSGNFYIVAGSFTLYSNAQKLNQKLKEKGFDSKILEPYGLYIHVTVNPDVSAEEARAALPTLRGQVDQTLWLLVR